ncbi:hypothetical protein HanIR_Chr03g0126911 [Helianthus annuus]|nr:hypothetical protein HanIR_Chr03g0126911 [Helianthus annuus]
MGQLKFDLKYFWVKTGRHIQRNGSMWVRIEFQAAGMSFGLERSWFGSDFGSARFLHGMGFGPT